MSPSSRVTRPHLGLTEIYSTPNPAVDIVFVHGVNGHASETWTTQNGVFWPIDLLPSCLDTREFRILTYGHTAGLRAFIDEIGNDQVNHHAMNLMEELCNERLSKQAAKRPIIFVAHSLGGLIVKLCLIYSQSSDCLSQDEYFQSIYLSTFGILFFGTPHSVSDRTEVSTSLQLIETAMLSQEHADFSRRLTIALNADNDMLRNINQNFNNILPRFRIAFFYECTPMNVMGVYRLIVGQDSAAPSILGVGRSGIRKDHFEMCKFGDSTSIDFAVVAHTLACYLDQSQDTICKRWEEVKQLRSFQRKRTNKEELDWQIHEVPETQRYLVEESVATKLQSEVSPPNRYNVIQNKTTVETFTYGQLHGKEIRLVVLRAGEGDMPVEVSLNLVAAPDASEYDALSYVWGPADESASVNLRVGRRILKHATSQVLVTALQQLRYSHEDRLLWIDALSINQKDLVERSRETQRMDQIFGSAKTVCIWLGTESDESSLAMDLVARIADFSFEDAADDTDGNKKRWLALTSLMGRPWFSRRWCVQEVALAKDAIVYCGAKSIPWSDFADAAVFFGSKWDKVVKRLSWREAYEFGEVQFPGAASLVDVSSHLFRMDHDGKKSEPLYNIETLLSMLAMFEVTNSLDAFYALKSLASDTYKNPDMVVDYSLQPNQLFQKVVKIILQISSSLDIICRPWAPVTTSIYPSWIVTVRQFPFVRRSDGQYDRQSGDSLVGLPGKRIYNACSISTGLVDAEIDINSMRLRAKGFVLGKLEDVADRCVNGNIPARWMELGGWATRSGTAPASFWKTLVADRGLGNNYRPPNWFGRACERLFSRTRAPTPDIDLTKLLTMCEDTSGRLQQFLSRCIAVAWNRSFFLLKLPHGNSYRNIPGLGPATIRKDDFVCILFGCSVPVVLRPRGKNFELLGECFALGLMDGEAMSGLDAGIFVKREFQIV